MAQTHRALLLLPPAPSPPSYAALKAAYNAPLTIVLKQLSRVPRKAQQSALLDVVLPCPHLYGRLDSPRGPLYAVTQQLVADLYKLICIVAARDSIDTEDSEAVDSRVVLLAYPRDGELTNVPDDTIPEQELRGPAIELHVLARRTSLWDVVIAIESEEGEQLLQNFQKLSGARTSVERVRGGIVQVERVTPDEHDAERMTSPIQHHSVAVGGTFDHLHIGHKLLLTMFAFVLGRQQPAESGGVQPTLTVGITGDALLKKKKYAEQLESWKRRQEAVHDFLLSVLYFGPPDDQRVTSVEIHESGPNGHVIQVTYPLGWIVKYVEIWDPFGPTITDKNITALVLSLETKSGGSAVNQKRSEQNWPALEVFEVAVLDASEEDHMEESFQSKLSSTEIRRKRSERMHSRS